MDGTYKLQVYKAPNDYETVVMVLARTGGVLRGVFVEVLWRMLVMEDGEAEGGAFCFHVPPFITVYGDISIEVSGKVEGDSISGEFVTPVGKLPFSGGRISDSVIPLG